MSDRNWEAYAKSTYQWEQGHEKYLRMTKTSLTSDFGYCRFQYKKKRIEGRKSPTTDAMTRGTNVHDAMEEFYINVRPVYKKAHALLKKQDREGAKALLMGALPTPEEPYRLGEDPIIEQRIDWELVRLEADPDRFLPIINELEVHAFVDVPFNFNGEELTIPVHFAGSIDRGYSTEEDKVALMELKTGKWVGTNFKVRSMRTEMAFYWDLLRKADHPLQDVTHWGWFYPAGHREDIPNSENHVTYEKVSKRYLTSISKSVNELIEAYLTDNFPPQPSTGKCAHCDFVDECPAWADGGDIYWKGGWGNTLTAKSAAQRLRELEEKRSAKS
tara:strand:- start:2271 stop:3260 length:990 start_codon:yes stop_codon:yes gene_type:complete